MPIEKNKMAVHEEENADVPDESVCAAIVFQGFRNLPRKGPYDPCMGT